MFVFYLLIHFYICSSWTYKILSQCLYMFINIFLETTIFTWFTQIQMVSLFTSLFRMSQPFVLEAYFDGAGGSISNWRSLLSEIVLTPRFLNDILENFPVLPPKQVGLGKDVSVNRALLLLQFLSSSALVHLLSLLSYSVSSTWLLADELLAFSANSSPDRTHVSAAHTVEKHTATILCKRNN